MLTVSEIVYLTKILFFIANDLLLDKINLSLQFDYASCFLKNSTVRCQASSAAGLSYRGVVSLWKP